MLDEKDMWLLAGERRFENMDMPILTDRTAYTTKADKGFKKARLVDLPTDLPQSVQSFVEFVDGKSNDLQDLTFEYQLAVLLRYLASPWQHEPLNSPSVHYPVSSFGGLFSCGLMLVVKTAQQSTNIYRYHGNYHALEFVGHSDFLFEQLGESDFAFAGVGEYWTVGRKYGEFAPYGVAFDVGIVGAQLGYLMAILGWEFSTFDLDPVAWNQALGFTGDCEQCLLCLPAKTTKPLDLAFLANHYERKIAYWCAPAGLTDRFLHLMQIVDYFAAFEPTESVSQPLALSPLECLPADDDLQAKMSDDLFTVMLRRSAANDAWGFSQVSAMVADNFLTRFVQVMQRLAGRRSYFAGEAALNVSYAWINPYGPPIGMYDQDGKPLTVLMPGSSCEPANAQTFIQIIQDCLYSQGQQYNLSTMMFEMFVCVDINKAIESCGRKSLRNAHLAAGAVVHDCCLAAAAFGGFARPVRMFRDIQLESRLNLKGQLLIQVLVGVSRHTNFSMKLL